MHHAQNAHASMGRTGWVRCYGWPMTRSHTQINPGVSVLFLGRGSPGPDSRASAPSSRRARGVFEASSRRLRGVFEAYPRRIRGVFEAFSRRIRGVSEPHWRCNTPGVAMRRVRGRSGPPVCSFGPPQPVRPILGGAFGGARGLLCALSGLPSLFAPY